MLNSNVSIVGYCVECDKPIRNPYFNMGKGPYGKYCYKKLFGNIKVFSIKFRKSNLKNEDSAFCDMGIIKNCKNCILLDVCISKDKV